ncbi:MAG TPA: hypothetical protein VFS43_17855 [Polyangiaceae bacterium]|nr:hypothetical protein [Polyangiaceae bacterium]
MSYLILRQLYDGDVIEWPVGDEHPLAGVFAALEAQGYVARWDRMWPLRDRYRLTERGIAAIEAVYRPSEAEAVFQRLRAEGPAGRRAVLRAHRLDPRLWPVLHDPHTHWSNWPHFRGPWHDYVWEDEVERGAPPAPGAASGASGAYDAGEAVPAPWPRRDVVDLDADAGRVGFGEGDRADYDVS